MTFGVLVLGFDPVAVGGDPAASEPAFAEARRQAAEQDVELVECLVAPDESAVPRSPSR